MVAGGLVYGLNAGYILVHPGSNWVDQYNLVETLL